MAVNILKKKFGLPSNGNAGTVATPAAECGRKDTTSGVAAPLPKNLSSIFTSKKPSKSSIVDTIGALQSSAIGLTPDVAPAGVADLVSKVASSTGATGTVTKPVLAPTTSPPC